MFFFHSYTLDTCFDNQKCSVNYLKKYSLVDAPIKIDSSNVCMVLHQQFHSTECCHLPYQLNIAANLEITNKIQRLKRNDRCYYLFFQPMKLRTYDPGIIIEIWCYHTTRTVHHLLMQRIFKIMLIPNRILSV